MSENNHEPQFDSLAPLYEDMANWPFRKEIEIPAVLTRLGDLCGLRILDFGCGSGHYSRLLKAKGAERVVGYDVAGGMLHYALEREAQERRGIEYASDLRGFESQFDLVLGVYVLPYAATRAQLSAMVRSMVALLRPGGPPAHAAAEPGLRAAGRLLCALWLPADHRDAASGRQRSSPAPAGWRSACRYHRLVLVA
ncbi:class I SAM-dependent methyltransferase [Serratia ficaria]|uniref:class I SAM-dependent methyltransferase n=1 Tax=Serratia ficaria TaxID=61651 RepID=UPI0021B77EAB|nr:class I SAM-dependent methyltransferase [Serratia ficaria]